VTRADKSIKRAFDLTASVVGLLVLSPLILICMLVAGIETRTLGLFRQTRVGRFGKPFNVLKIRTMYPQQIYGSSITVLNDRRITRSGRWLRRFKLDELPQLVNVVRGEMALVGPRPDVPGYADQLTDDARRVLELRPGITGPATLRYRDEEAMLAAVSDPTDYNARVIYPDKVRLNMLYLRNWSFVGDLRYILMTARLIQRSDDLIAPGHTEQ